MSASDPVTQLHPGLNTLVFEETLTHFGAPSRVALGLESADEGFEDCVLLDHIPHRDNGPNPSPRNSFSLLSPNSTNIYRIAVWIPNVRCERCTLQLIGLMTDAVHGMPENSSCAYPEARNATVPLCPVVYHSCATISINGSMPRNSFNCKEDTNVGGGEKWPWRGLESVYQNMANQGTWDGDYHLNSTLDDASKAHFGTETGSCGTNSGTQTN